MASHPEVDMVGLTGSTRAGIQVAMAAAPTVKRVEEELGGKSPNIILPTANIAASVASGVEGSFANSGQSCDAPTRMFVPRGRHDEALAIARERAEALVTGDPRDGATNLGPVVSRVHYEKIQSLKLALNWYNRQSSEIR
jgi:aldehyde dehydrogenase (NAD+)